MARDEGEGRQGWGRGREGRGKETRSAELVNHPGRTHKRPPHSYGRTVCDVASIGQMAW